MRLQSKQDLGQLDSMRTAPNAQYHSRLRERRRLNRTTAMPSLIVISVFLTVAILLTQSVMKRIKLLRRVPVRIAVRR